MSKRDLTQAEEKRFRDLYHNTTNIELGEMFNMHVNTVSRLGHKLGLKKDQSHLRGVNGFNCRYDREKTDMLCWECRGATNPPDHKCLWASRFEMPKSVKTKERTYYKDNERCKRTYIVACPNFERG